jgi:DNA topoisomerase II
MSKKVSKLNEAIKAIHSGTSIVKGKKEGNKKTSKKEVEEEDIKVDESQFDTSFEIGKKKGDINYKKLELHSQILLRPDTYIGSCKLMNEQVYIKEDNIIKEKDIKYPEGLIRIFIEVLSNAIDNTWRSLQEGITPKFIKINITEDGKVSVWNDGKNIPLDIHPEEKVYIPEMIFGQLLTSSNYNDDEERKTSGRNGYGVKLSSIFSSSFKIEIYNKHEGKIYTQEWSENMYKKSTPNIKSKGFPKTVEDGKNGYTLVEFIPDFKRFNIDKFTPDILSLYEKLVYDTAMTVSLKGVKVIFNGEPVKVNNLKDYVNLYFTEPQKDMLLLSSKDCKVVLCPSNEFTQVSFVNGIYTKDGGVHVKKWTETIFKPIVEKINDGLKGKGHIDISHVKKHFFIFIYADLINPSFKNQNKTFLDGPQVEADIKEPEIKKLMKWGFVEKIKDSLKSKELNTLKTETERKRGTVDVDGLKDANFAGKKGKNTDCVLTVTEGDSANTYAIAGMKYGLKFNGKEVKGRDYIGSLPIRGKFLNVRNASIQSLLKNSEVKSLIQALGLQYDLDYSIDDNYKKLRYGRILALTDADVDGYHITGLLFNFIHTLFPTLAKRKGFFNLMRIPIVKISGKHNKSFFTQHAAEEYIEKHKPKKDDIKYFKGLGTAQDEDIEEDFGRRLVEFEVDDCGDKMMDNIFGKENADFRKDWIINYEQKPPKEGKDYTIEDLTITDFLNNEMILFSIDDCKRSIPSMIDGLKESQRKIIFSAFKRKLNYNDKSIKVAQFSGYVAEHSGYHHGEQNLIDTTIKMAQTFVGSNNCPLFFNEGQFGSRTMNGNDAASGRYLFTKLNIPTRYMFRVEDDDFLKDRTEEGEIVEKDFYVPIVPTILINGCSAGIGSGFSSSIPSYKMEDIINQINRWLDKQDFEDIVPWYRGFKGVIKVDGKKIVTEGLYEKIKENTYRVTELPIGKSNISIDKYETFLKELQKEKKIISFSSNCTENIVDFTLTVTEEFEVNLKNLNLVDNLYTSNMVMFNPENKIKKYDTVKDILEEFCNVRYSLYEVRKEGIIKDMEEELKYLKNKINFITEIVNNTISLKERDDESLNIELTTKKYDMKEGSFDYLLNIQVRSMTSKRIKELKDKETDLKHQLDRYRIKTIKDIWKEELNELVIEYNKWLTFENGRKISKIKSSNKDKKVSKK